MLSMLGSMFGGKSKRAPRGAAPRRTCLALECLEERAVPSASTMQGSDPSTTGSSGASGTGTNGQQATLSAQDQQFLIHQVQGDKQEIVLGLLAMQKGNTPLVQEYGYILVTGHLSDLQSTLPLLQKFGIANPSLTSSQIGNILYFSQIQGSQFDQQFAQFMISDHDEDITLATNEANNSSSNPLVRQDASTELPMLYEHLYIAELIAYTEGTGSNSSNGSSSSTGFFGSSGSNGSTSGSDNNGNNGNNGEHNGNSGNNGGSGSSNT